MGVYDVSRIDCESGSVTVMAKDILYPLRLLHGYLHDFKTIALPILKEKKENPNAVFLLMTPEHSNLGDHAIAKAITKFLFANKIDYIEVTGKTLSYLETRNWLWVLKGRNVFLQGGGYLGTLWYTAERRLREIIHTNKNNSIVIFPNTIYYENTDWGNAEKAKSVELYGNHPNLHIYAREAISYHEMLSLYKNVKLVPDMVLSLNECQKTVERSGCLLCLRSDCERTRTDEQEAQVVQQAKLLFDENVQRTDMCANYSISLVRRNEELDKKFDQFRHAELIITDRLHGMIFAAITGTPCIVIDSKSPKVRGCYEWIKHLDYIKFADSTEKITQLYREIPPGPHKYDNTQLLPYYEKLAQDLQDILH